MSEYQGYIVATRYIQQRFLSIEVVLNKPCITTDIRIKLEYNIAPTTRKILDAHTIRDSEKQNEIIIEFYATHEQLSEDDIESTLHRIAEALHYAHIDIFECARFRSLDVSTH